MLTRTMGASRMSSRTTFSSMRTRTASSRKGSANLTLCTMGSRITSRVLRRPRGLLEGIHVERRDLLGGL
jgi:hypothetical protein